jgi:short-subunit dehydrogenase
VPARGGSIEGVRVAATAVSILRLESIVPKETALITGPSSGLGMEFARLFAADGSDLILVSRNQQKLEALAAELRQGHGVNVHVLPHDLSVPGSSQRVYDDVASRGLTVDVLVNNAGFGHLAKFEKIPVEVYAQNIQVNISAVTELTRLYLPGMIERKRGKILNVASTASFQPGPNAAVYFASKAYVRYFSEALSEELRGSGVTVTAFCPGPTKTGFGELAHMETAPLFRFAAESAPVARAGYQAMRSGRTTIVTGLGNKVLALNSKIFPGWIVRKVTMALMSGKGLKDRDQKSEVGSQKSS